MDQVAWLKMNFVYSYPIRYWKATGGNDGEWEGIISNPTAAILSDPGATWVAVPQGLGIFSNSPR